MSIYTRAGDEGETSLAGGRRVSKADPRVEAFGAIDEASSAIGLALAAADAAKHADVREILLFAQHRLANCAACLSNPEDAAEDEHLWVSPDDVASIERAADAFEAGIGACRGFVLPGGDELAARLHLARTIVRRAERRVVALGAARECERSVGVFLNRLSDVLFAAARASLARADIAEANWDSGAARPEL